MKTSKDKTHTGMIVSDDELKLEYLYVGDYGKENNIKADFLGYTNRIEKVEHKDVDITDKLVVTVSSQKGSLWTVISAIVPSMVFTETVQLSNLFRRLQPE